MPRLGLGLGLDKLNIAAVFGKFPPCKDKLVQWTKATKTFVLDGITYLKDLTPGTKSGIEQGRGGRGSGKLLGDGTRYVVFDERNLGTNHTIEFMANPTASTELVLGNESSLGQYIGFITDRINYQIAGGDSISFALTLDGTSHVYRMVRTDLSVELFVDGVSEGVSSFASNLDFNCDVLGQGGSSFIFNYELPYINLNGYTANFEESNASTTVYFTNGEGDFFEGEIQNATGADRATDYSIPSQADLVGHTVSRALGKNLFDKSVVDEGYLNSAGGIISVTDWYTSDYILVESSDYVFKSINNNAVAYVWTYDKDFNQINGYMLSEIFADSNTITISGDERYLRFTGNVIQDPIDVQQLEQGTTATTYEPYEGYFDKSGNPIPQGVIIPYAGNGLAAAYLDATQTVQAPSQFVGELKADKRLVNGVVDNGVGYSNWDDSSPLVTIENETITFTGDGASVGDVINVNMENVENNEVVTLAFMVDATTIGAGSYFALSSSSISGASVFIDVSKTGRVYTTFTTANPITSNRIRLLIVPGVDAGKSLTISDIALYKGTITAVNEPTGVTAGNSEIQVTKKRDSLLANEPHSGGFDADGATNYIDTGIVPNQDTVMKVWGKFNDLSGIHVIGNDADYMIGFATSLFWRIWVGGTSFTSTTAIDDNVHEFEWNDGELYIDGIYDVGTKGSSVGTPVNSIWLLGASTSRYADFTMYKAEITHNGDTYTWLPNKVTGEVDKYVNGVRSTATIEGTVTSDQYVDPAVLPSDGRYYNTYDLDNIVEKVVPITDTNQVIERTYYDKADGEESLVYNPPLGDDCDTETKTYIGGV